MLISTIIIKLIINLISW